MSKRSIVMFVSLVLIFLPTLIAIQRGGVLNVAIPTDVVETLDPHKATGALTFEILYNVYEPLLDMDENGMLVPVLAKEWIISEDGLRYTFFLKETVSFHDGSYFSSKDVQYSFERILDPQTVYPKASNYAAIETILSPDPYTVEFILHQVYAPFLALVSKIHIVPYGADEGLERSPIGTGPFVLKEWRRDQYLYLEAFPDYHENELPYLDGAYFRVIPDLNVQVLSLRKGDIHVIPRLDPAYMFDLINDPNFTYRTAPMNLVQVLAINNARSPLTDIRLRQAITHAVDRQALIDVVAEGYGKPLTSHMPTGDYHSLDLSEMYPYDPAKARALIDEIGPLPRPLVIALPQPYPLHQRTGEVIGQMLSNVGIPVQLRIVEWGTWLADVYRAREYDMTVIGHPGEPDPFLLLDRFYSDVGRNYMNYFDPEMDQLLNASLEEVDFDNRALIIQQILYKLAEEAVAVWIMEPEEIVGLRKEVQGWIIYPIYVDALKKVWLAK